MGVSVFSLPSQRDRTKCHLSKSAVFFSDSSLVISSISRATAGVPAEMTCTSFEARASLIFVSCHLFEKKLRVSFRSKIKIQPRANAIAESHIQLFAMSIEFLKFLDFRGTVRNSPFSSML
jgi:hypothetical protein